MPNKGKMVFQWKNGEEMAHQKGDYNSGLPFSSHLLELMS